MKIVILNWRDIKNPQSGGAEILTHEIAKRFVKEGHEVLYISSRFKGSKKTEKIDGINFLRMGHPDARYLFWSLHFKFILFYLKKIKGKFDVIIEEIHGVPFFTPFFIKERKIVLICEVAGHLWDVAVKFPFNKFGKLLENIYPLFYRKINWITISPSTKKELIRKNIPAKNIFIIPMGSDVPVVKKLPRKSKKISLIFLARLSKQKGIENALYVTKYLKQEYPEVLLHIVGRSTSDYLKFLKKKVRSLEILENVVFHGFISQKEKYQLLSKVSILIAPSFKEGWGLTVHEAGARGTPSIAYNVEGLRDVVKDGVNGILCRKNTPEEMAKEIITLHKNNVLYGKIQKNILEETGKLSWHKTYEELLKIITK